MKTKEKIDWEKLSKDLERMYGGNRIGLNLENPEVILRFQVACEMYQRILFPMNWERGTALATTNPITKNFGSIQWCTLAQSSMSEFIHDYALEVALFKHIETFEEDNWEFDQCRHDGLAQLLSILLGKPKLLQLFADQIVMIFTKGFAHRISKYNALVSFTPAWVILAHEYLIVAKNLRFISLVKDFSEIKKNLLRDFSRTALMSHEFFLGELEKPGNYHEQRVFELHAKLFPVLLIWEAWKGDGEVVKTLQSIITQSLISSARLPMFDLLLLSHKAKQGEQTHWKSVPSGCLRETIRELQEWGVDTHKLFRQPNFIRQVKYWSQKIV